MTAYVAGNRMGTIKLTNDAVWTLRDQYKKWQGVKYTHVKRIPDTSNPVLYSINGHSKDFFGSLNSKSSTKRHLITQVLRAVQLLRHKDLSGMPPGTNKKTHLSTMLMHLMSAI